METFSFKRSSVLILLVILCWSLPSTLAAKKRKLPRTTAHTVVDPVYERERLPDGEWKPETYAFGEGKMLDPTDRDESLTTLTFHEIGEILAKALYMENYFPTQNPEETDLMILVNWGKTVPGNDGLRGSSIDGMTTAMNSISQISSDISARGADAQPTGAESGQMDDLESQMTSMLMMQGMAERERRESNDYNARLLGYAPALHEAYSFEPIGMQRNYLDSLVEEIETPRYFVILIAYDFQQLIKENKKVILWISRFNIKARGRKFDEELLNMALAASSLFGQKSGRLKRNLLPGEVELGELEVIGREDDVSN